MTPWKQNFESQKGLEHVRAATESLSNATTEGLNEDAVGQYARLVKVLKVLEQRFSGLDPELFPTGSWANFNSWLADVRSNAEHFRQNKNPGHLQNANNSLDGVLKILRPIDLGMPPEGIIGISDAATAYQRHANADLEGLRRAIGEASSALEHFRNELNQSKARLDQNNQTIEQQKSRLDQSIAEFQKQFSQTEATRSSEFSAALARINKDSSELQDTLKRQAQDALDRRKADYEAFLAAEKQASDANKTFLKTRENEVNEIFGAIGSSSLSGHFKKTADDDCKAANRFRWISLSLMSAMVVVGGLAFYQSLKHPEISWQVFAFRLGTTLVLALPAIYAAQESAKHREREKANRKLQLELASIDAYLALFPQAKQFEIKEKLTEKFFGKADLPTADEPVTKHALFELLSSVLKNVTKPK